MAAYDHSKDQVMRIDLAELRRQEREAQDVARKNTKYVRYHPSGHMGGLGEFRGVTGSAAIVLRPDGSVDVYGDVAVIDQMRRDDT